MPISLTITPNIDNRLSAWMNVAQASPKKEINPCITISREYGCQAYLTAQALEARLSSHNNSDQEWITLDRKLLEKIAEESGYSKTTLEQARDMNPIWEAAVSMFMGKHRAEPYEVFNYLKKAIRHFAQNGNCIVIGRAGANITQDLSNCLHLRLVAPLKFRVRNIMETMDLSEEDARAQIEDHQHQRDEFVRKFTEVSPEQAHLYHLVLNNAHHTPEQIAELVEHAMRIQNLLPKSA